MEIQLKEQVISLEHQVSLLSQSVAELRKVKENLSYDRNIQEMQDLCLDLQKEREQRICAETELEELKRRFEIEITEEREKRLELEQQCAELTQQLSEQTRNVSRSYIYFYIAHLALVCLYVFATVI
ncbi:hypothetical protein C0J52_22499 [Blattella germanica]|nr:hypothetical protein C0J52_22499 [Blattella germanica]